MSESMTVSGLAPKDDVITAYDRKHMTIYLRLLDAETAGADWSEVAAVVLKLDPDKDDRAEAIWSSHLARAHWMRDSGYKQLIYA